MQYFKFIKNEFKYEIYKGNCYDLMNDLINGGIKVDGIMTSPPYYKLRKYSEKSNGKNKNLGVYEVCKSGQAYEGEVGQESIYEEYLVSIEKMFKSFQKLIKNDKFIFVNIGNKHENKIYIDNKKDFVMLAQKAGLKYLGTIYWFKSNATAGRHKKIYLANAWEYILIFTNGENIEIESKNKFKNKLSGEEYVFPPYIKTRVGCCGRKMKPLINHPAIYPIDIPNTCLFNGCNKGDIILDPFLGSGTTLISCQDNKMNFIGCELIPNLYDSLVKTIDEKLV